MIVLNSTILALNILHCFHSKFITIIEGVQLLQQHPMLRHGVQPLRCILWLDLPSLKSLTAATDGGSPFPFELLPRRLLSINRVFSTLTVKERALVLTAKKNASIWIRLAVSAVSRRSYVLFRRHGRAQSFRLGAPQSVIYKSIHVIIIGFVVCASLLSEQRRIVFICP